MAQEASKTPQEGSKSTPQRAPRGKHRPIAAGKRTTCLTFSCLLLTATKGPRGAREGPRRSPTAPEAPRSPSPKGMKGSLWKRATPRGLVELFPTCLVGFWLSSHPRLTSHTHTPPPSPSPSHLQRMQRICGTHMRHTPTYSRTHIGHIHKTHRRTPSHSHGTSQTHDMRDTFSTPLGCAGGGSAMRGILSTPEGVRRVWSLSGGAMWAMAHRLAGVALSRHQRGCAGSGP